jgi:hypothetical protein
MDAQHRRLHDQLMTELENLSPLHLRFYILRLRREARCVQRDWRLRGLGL